MRSRRTFEAKVCAALGGLALLAAGCSDDDHEPIETPASVEFGYAGDTGPGFWGDLSPDFAACATDTRQSPLDIVDTTPDATLESLDVHLEPTPLHIVNNGHVLEQEYEDGSEITFEGVTYALAQFHFHTLSEHTIAGSRGAMELHAVFKNADTGTAAVVGKIFDIGEENPFLAAYEGHLPEVVDEEFSDAAEVNVADGLGDTSQYYTYPGSLTTPPCSPVVTWLVLKERGEMSEAQFDEFNGIMGNNFRPLQERNGREIRETP